MSPTLAKAIVDENQMQRIEELFLQERRALRDIQERIGLDAEVAQALQVQALVDENEAIKKESLGRKGTLSGGLGLGGSSLLALLGGLGFGTGVAGKVIAHNEGDTAVSGDQGIVVRMKTSIKNPDFSNKALGIGGFMAMGALVGMSFSTVVLVRGIKELYQASQLRERSKRLRELEERLRVS